MDDMTTAQVMTSPVVTLRPDQSVPTADELMDNGRFRHLPVVDENDRVVGIVTHRDLLASRVSSLSGLDDDERRHLQRRIPVERIMRRQVWTVRPEQPALQTALLLRDLSFGCAPVVDDERRLLGIVTDADFLRLAGKVLESSDSVVRDLMSYNLVTLGSGETLKVADLVMSLERIRHIPVVDDERGLVGLLTHRDLLDAQRSSLTPAQRFPADATIADAMRADVRAIAPDESAADAARILLNNDLGCLPVVADGQLVGIVTEADFVAAAVKSLAPRPEPPRHDAPVNYYMSEPAHSVRRSDDIAVAQRRMVQHRVAGLAVVDNHDRLCGALSITDLLEVRKPGAARGGRRALLSLPEMEVADIATRRALAVRANAPVVEAAAAMLRRGVHRLFVIGDGDDRRRPIGVLSTTDLMLALRDFGLATPIGAYAASPLFTADVSVSIRRTLELLEKAGLSGVVVRDGVWPVGFFSRQEAIASRHLPEDTPVGHAMSQALICVPSSTPIHRVAGQAAELRARRVVTLEEGHTSGIISGMDFALMLAAAR